MMSAVVFVLTFMASISSSSAWMTTISSLARHQSPSVRRRAPSMQSTRQCRTFHSSSSSLHSAVAASQSSHSSNTDDTAETTKKLRSLYDPPPRMDIININDPSNAVTSNSLITQVTNGTLTTQDGSGHILYYEVHRRFHLSNNAPSKSKRGLTALVLHGGPGAGCFPNHVNFFSPHLYEHVVLLDQRGCGRSVPRGQTQGNTLKLLVDDVEMLRRELAESGLLGGDGNIQHRPWDCILGGSWGCTLGLAYAHTYPNSVRSMVLRGVCLFRPREIDWLFGDPPLISEEEEESLQSIRRTSNLRELIGGGGSLSRRGVVRREGGGTKQSIAKTASELFPEAWKEFCKGVEPAQQQQTNAKSRSRSVLHQYHHRLLGSDPLLRARASQSWFRWEMGIYSSGFSSDGTKTDGESSRLLVWNPRTSSWSYEDSREENDQSATCVDESEAQMLRRLSTATTSDESSTTQSERVSTITTVEPSVLEPMPVEQILNNEATPSNTSNSNATSTNNIQTASNSTFDPASYIPAQAMLTCHYCTNDEYVLHPYESFLSLSSSSTTPSWYSSKLPPSPTKPSDGNTMQPDEKITITTKQPYPLPPCIAIQGGKDAICPPDTALDLHHVWKELELRIAFESGHSMYDTVIASEIVKATDRFGHALMEDEDHRR